MKKYVDKEIKFIVNNDENSKHILLCGDKDYIKRCGVTLTSVAINNPDMFLTFHIVCDDITDIDLEKLSKSSRKFEINIHIYILDPKVISSLLGSVNLEQGISVAAFFRIIGFDILCNVIETVLYIDSDIMVCDSIKDLWNIDLNEKYAAVVRDILEWELKDAIKVKQYFNSGVILANLIKWKNERLTEICVQNIINEKYKWMDQDALNVIFDSQCIFIDKKYNFLLPLEKKGFDYGRNDVCIIHFVGRSKPWCSWVCNIPIVKQYMNIQEKSLWFDNKLYRPEDEKDKKYRYKYVRLDLQIAYRYREYRKCLTLIMKYLKYKIYYKFDW